MTQAPTDRNDLALLCRVLERLAGAGAPCLVFGGWAEELLGLSPVRRHGDIDLLLPGRSFARVDALLAGPAVPEEILAKRFAHKRAFLTDGIMVEVTLVQPGSDGPVTRFWGDVPFRWLAPLGRRVPVAGAARSLAVATAGNLARYRALHTEMQPWRWRDPAMLVPRAAG
jgi:hypothetical protein